MLRILGKKSREKAAFEGECSRRCRGVFLSSSNHSHQSLMLEASPTHTWPNRDRQLTRASLDVSGKREGGKGCGKKSFWQGFNIKQTPRLVIWISLGVLIVELVVILFKNSLKLRRVIRRLDCVGSWVFSVII